MEISETTAEFGEQGRFPGREVAGEDMEARFAYQPKVKSEVVDGANLQAQNFLGTYKVVEVSEGVDSVGLGGARGVDGLEAALPLLVFDIDCAFSGEQQSVTSIERGHNAVEHIDSALDSFEDILGCSHTHQIAWFTSRKD